MLDWAYIQQSLLNSRTSLTYKSDQTAQTHPETPFGDGSRNWGTSPPPAFSKAGLANSSVPDTHKEKFPRSRTRPELLVKSPSREGSAENRANRPGCRRSRRRAGAASRSRKRRRARSSWAPHLAIVADKHHAVAGVNRARTEITLLNTHVETAWGPSDQTPIVSGNDVAPSQEVILFNTRPEKASVLRP